MKLRPELDPGPKKHSQIIHPEDNLDYTSVLASQNNGNYKEKSIKKKTKNFIRINVEKCATKLTNSKTMTATASQNRVGVKQSSGSDGVSSTTPAKIDSRANSESKNGGDWIDSTQDGAGSGSPIVTVSHTVNSSSVDVVVSVGHHTWEGWNEQESETEMTSTKSPVETGVSSLQPGSIPEQQHSNANGNPVAGDSNDGEDSQSSRVASENNGIISSPPKTEVKSILKKSRLHLSLNKTPKRRITFNDTMTVFCDVLGMSIVAMRPDEILADDIHAAYEPPPEYQDRVDFDPPDEYKDERFETVMEVILSEPVNDNKLHKIEDNSSLVKTLEKSYSRIKDGSDSDDTVTNDQQQPQPASSSVPGSVKFSAELDVSVDEGAKSPTNSLLTKENLKQHEQLMKKEVASSLTPSQHPSSVPPPTPPPPPPTSPPPMDSDEQNVKELSPPLKHLSVRVPSEPPKADGDWQVELSPLNSTTSTQETESDSSLSSQDTIILMTSDESKRNEEHIKESLKIYEGLKKTDSSSLSSSGSDETKSSAIGSETPSSDQTSSSSSGVEGWSSDDIRRVIERNAMRRSMQRFTETRRKQTGYKKSPETQSVEKTTSLADRIKLLTCVEDTDSGVDSEKNNSDSSLSPSSSTKRYVPQQQHNQNVIPRQYSSNTCPGEDPIHNPGGLTSRQRHSLAYHGYISPLTNASSPPRPHFSIHRSASELHVPSSGGYCVTPRFIARERHHSGPEKSHLIYEPQRNIPEESNHCESFCDNSTISELEVTTNTFNSKLAEGGVDELELFVKQDSDRTNRIRQRYSYSSEADSSYEMSPDTLNRKPSVRGIKARFGSTTQILQQIQSQNQRPSYASQKKIGSHMTWPYKTEVASSNSANSPNHPQMPSSQSSVALKSVVQDNLIPKNSENIYQMRGRRGRESFKMSVIKDERGTPEGASSSPKVSSDPLCPPLQKTNVEESNTNDGIIFYSMNV